MASSLSFKKRLSERCDERCEGGGSSERPPHPPMRPGVSASESASTPPKFHSSERERSGGVCDGARRDRLDGEKGAGEEGAGEEGRKAAPRAGVCSLLIATASAKMRPADAARSEASADRQAPPRSQSAPDPPPSPSR